jgi:hypothetical protein
VAGRQVKDCRWCGSLITWDSRSSWIHVDGSYACRDSTNVLLATYAEPGPSPHWRLNLERGR